MLSSAKLIFNSLQDYYSIYLDFAFHRKRTKDHKKGLKPSLVRLQTDVIQTKSSVRLEFSMSTLKHTR